MVIFAHSVLAGVSGGLNTIEEERFFLYDVSGPVVTLETANQTTFLTTNINLTYNAVDTFSGIRNCSLTVDDTLNQNNLSITESLSTAFFIQIADGDHNWSVSCTDTPGNVGTSQTRNFTIAVPSAPSGGGTSGQAGTGLLSCEDGFTLINLSCVEDEDEGIIVPFFQKTTSFFGSIFDFAKSFLFGVGSSLGIVSDVEMTVTDTAEAMNNIKEAIQDNNQKVKDFWNENMLVIIGGLIAGALILFLIRIPILFILLVALVVFAIRWLIK